MSRLLLRLGASRVGASLVGAESVELLVPRPGPLGGDEVDVEVLWAAVVACVQDVLDAGGRPTTLAVLDDPGSLVVWDDDSLGAARPAVLASAGAGAAARLDALREREPRVWAWVAEGRCVVGSIGSYVVCRAGRGTYHLCDDPDWPVGPAWPGSPDRVEREDRAAWTDSAAFLGLALPVSFTSPAISAG